MRLLWPAGTRSQWVSSGEESAAQPPARAGRGPSYFPVQYCSAGALCLESEPQTHGETGGNKRICWDLSKAAPTFFWGLGGVWDRGVLSSFWGMSTEGHRIVICIFISNYLSICTDPGTKTAHGLGNTSGLLSCVYLQYTWVAGFGKEYFPKYRQFTDKHCNIIHRLVTEIISIDSGDT